MYMKLISSSRNRKTGAISQTYSDKSTCPVSCPFRNNGCYGDNFPTSIHWKRCDTPIDEANIDTFSYIIRHNVCGDIAISGTNNIDSKLLKQLDKLYTNHLAYTYTHCAKTIDNFNKAKHSHMIINFSCETIEQVENCIKNDIPSVLVVKSMQENTTYINNHKYVKCLGDCVSCKKCMDRKRDYTIVFEAHGVKKKKLDYLLKI